ncbi:cell surface A33 antigen-like [Emydura macquarii macquarii]|uniref:cell surface A33 antigen-like n=1 Tax=Emydura macquarii macquarii TaxID=1129001 RepID=UPI00352ACC80
MSLWMGATEKTAAVIVVNQTPPYIRAMEGSEFTIECRVNVSSHLTKWFVEWKITRNNVTKPLNGTDRIIISRDEEKMFYLLTVKEANITDSGTYVCYGGSKQGISSGSGTQVTINEITDLMVNQTPANIHKSEGSDLSMECRFMGLKKPNTMYVKWYKHNGSEGMKKELMSERDRNSIALDLEKGFSSLTLKKVNVTDTGTYVCEVGILARNLSMSGAGTQVTINKRSNASDIVFIIRMVLGALIVIVAVIIITECVISETRAFLVQCIRIGMLFHT